MSPRSWKYQGKKTSTKIVKLFYWLSKGHDFQREMVLIREMIVQSIVRCSAPTSINQFL